MENNLPRSMRKPRSAGGTHYYIDPKGILIYPNGPAPVRLTRRQIEQIMEILYDYPPNPEVKQS